MYFLSEKSGAQKILCEATAPCRAEGLAGWTTDVPLWVRPTGFCPLLLCSGHVPAPSWMQGGLVLYEACTCPEVSTRDDPCAADCHTSGEELTWLLRVGPAAGGD